jgi:FixJ family two-component response regulator
MSIEPDPVVFVVDDDAALRGALKFLLESVGLHVAVYSRAEEFLRSYLREFPLNQPGCLLLDVRMPGMSGLHAQQKLPEVGIDLPVIIITGHADVSMAVTSMKQGAFDFVEKPFNDQLLLDSVQNALEHNMAHRRSDAHRQEVLDRFATLTPREREVMERVVEGMHNKVIAADLLVSRKTVEVHRAKVMEKLQAESLSDLIQMAMNVGILCDFVESGRKTSGHTDDISDRSPNFNE